MTKVLRRSTSASVIAMSMLLPGIAFAQVVAGAAPQAASDVDDGGIAEIVVTAQRKSENLQRVPITVNSLSADTLAQTGAIDINDIAKLVPGFRGNGDAATTSAHLRGAGNASISAGNDSAVAYYIDGIYYPTSLTGPLSIKDAARIEVLKGPQGTLFGRNSTAGLVQIITRSPTDKLELEAEAGYANYETVTASGYVGTPVTDTIGVGFSISGKWQGKGWGTNVATGEDIRKTNHDIAMRGKVVFEPSERTKLVISGDYQKTKAYGTWAFALNPSPQNTGLGLYSIGKSWNVNADAVNKVNGRGKGVSATLTQDLGFATLTSITGYRKHVFPNNNLEYDGTPVPGLIYNDLQTAKQFTQELQLSSNANGPLSWTAGVFYFDARDTNDGDFVILPIFQPGFGNVATESTRGTQRTKSIAGYAQANYAIAEGTTITLGGRYTNEKRRFSAPHFIILNTGTVVDLPTGSGKKSFNVPTWRVSLNQQISPDILGYVSVNRGFKSGGFNISNANNPPFDPEKLTAYETGLKTTLFDRRLRFNVAAFYYDYKDLQISAFPTGGGSSGLQILYNAAKAEFYGLDVDFDARIAGGLSITGGIELLHGEYKDFPGAAISTPAPTGGYIIVNGSATGNRTSQTPKFSGTLGANYEVKSDIGTFLASADLNYNSGFFFDADNRGRQPSYTLVGASLRYTVPSERFYVQAWGKNLTNEAITGLYLTTPVASFGTLDAPRTYGVTAGFKF